MRFQCPFCRGIVAVNNTQVGEEVQCGHCDEVVTVPRSRFASGAVIGDFIILEELGRGGMGVVYLAHQISLDRPAALKILQENYANNAEFVVNFIQEARSAAKLNHPHIVQAYAVGEDEGVYYFAMEHIDGETMKSVLKRDRIIAVDKAVTIIQQIAEALDCAWKEQKLIHRDIKPDNIMLTKNGRAKLADLGLSKVAGDSEDADSDEVMGTPQYISPEHLTGAPMDVRSDIYSLGATFYQFVTGRFPYEGKSANEIARKHLEETLVPPQMVSSKVPEAVSQIIVKMMKKNANERYQDAEELVEDLRMFRRGKLSSNLSLPKIFSTRTRAVGIREANDSNATHHPLRSKKPTTPTTDSLPLPYTSTSTTSSDLLFAGNIEEEIEKPKSKLILWTVLLLVSVIVAGAAIVWFYVIPAMEEEKVAAPAPAPKQEIKVKPAPPPRDYIKMIDKVLLDYSAKPKDENAFLEAADRFFEKFPEPINAEERKKLTDFLRVYVSIDEKVRVAPERARLREQHLKQIAERKERAAREEAERKRREEIKRKQEAEARERERKERERREAIARRVRKYKASLETKKKELADNFMVYAKSGKNEAAEKMFKDAVTEPKNVETATHDEKQAAAKFADYAEELQKAYRQGAKVTELLTNSRELAGMKVEIARYKLAELVAVKDGLMHYKMIPSNEMVKLKVSDLSGFYLRKFFERIEKKTGITHAFFYYILFNGAFEYNLINFAPAAFWKNALPSFEYRYFLRELKKASTAQQKELREQFGYLDSFKKAFAQVK